MPIALDLGLEHPDLRVHPRFSAGCGHVRRRAQHLARGLMVLRSHVAAGDPPQEIRGVEADTLRLERLRGRDGLFESCGAGARAL